MTVMYRRNGLTAYNFSRGGMTAKEYIKSFAEEKGFWDKAKACQAYVIAIGINDLYNQKWELGSIEDIDKNDYHNNAKTFAGYYAQIISKYKEISPNAKFFLVGLPNEGDQRSKTTGKKMTELLYEFSKHFDNLYVIDLYKYASLFDNDFKAKYDLNSHLNPMGYMCFAEIIDSYIDYIIRNNLQEFQYVGLINSGIDYIK